MFREILTERLALRDLEVSDGQGIFSYRSRPEVSRFQSWGAESSDAIQLYIRGLSEATPGQPGSWYQIGIVVLSCGELIGDCGFQALETEPGHVEVGIALAPEFQGRGYANETLRALLDYLLAGLDKDRVFGSVDPRNVRSIRMLERVGMRKEAHRVKSLWFKGELVDDAIFAITANEWKSRNNVNYTSKNRPQE
jgi:RimJ/RimL family protein N-acetyltransferase